MSTTGQENINIDFDHKQSAHCESGVSSNLLRHYGINVSEAMAFGIGAGLFFGYLPFLRVNNLPLTTYRCEVGGIFKRVTKQLGCQVHWQTFSRPEKGMAALDEQLARGVPVGCRTGGYWLPYFPPAFRFHFNMHNLVVIGKEGDDYLVSDPVFPDPERCAQRDLIKARFAKGTMAPKGTMYFLKSVPQQVDLSAPIRKGIKTVCRRMLSTPGPVIGIRGIRFLAGQVKKWPKKLGEEKAVMYVGQLIRMQEELGTGGAGFRFMYAAFLQEAGVVLDSARMTELSHTMTTIGDRWRKAAVIGGRICKGRTSETDNYEAMSALLYTCAEEEGSVYRELLQLV